MLVTLEAPNEDESGCPAATFFFSARSPVQQFLAPPA